MRGLLITGTAALVLLAAASDAEARGRRRSFVAFAATTPARSTAAPAAAGTETAPARPPLLRPILPVPAPHAEVKPVRTAGPWCANRRVVGSGAGFCEIN